MPQGAQSLEYPLGGLRRGTRFTALPEQPVETYASSPERNKARLM